ncbi:MAG: hypothetical protein EA001_07725, partial [Oscillatoriales cyanobacterium]
MQKLQRLGRDRPWLVGLGVAGAIALGTGAALLPWGDWLTGRLDQSTSSPTAELDRVATLVSEPQQISTQKLQELARSPSS